MTFPTPFGGTVITLFAVGGVVAVVILGVILAYVIFKSPPDLEDNEKNPRPNS